jgi:hypothetical protein
MTEVEIKTDGKKFWLDVSEFRHIFVCEDETCAEISLTKKDVERLQKGIGVIP